MLAFDQHTFYVITKLNYARNMSYGSFLDQMSSIFENVWSLVFDD